MSFTLTSKSDREDLIELKSLHIVDEQVHSVVNTQHQTTCIWERVIEKTLKSVQTVLNILSVLLLSLYTWCHGGLGPST